MQQDAIQNEATENTIKLSVVVITYNMQRELPRTILSLSPAMQRSIAASDYEVIVIDNGSSDTAYLDALNFADLQLSVIKMPKVGSSPCAAVNAGIHSAKGEMVAVMVDGARMASPGLLANALKASQLCQRPIIATIAMHLGAEEQSTSVHHGYNQTVEDAMLATVDWQANGYQLFDMSVFAGSSGQGWFGPLAESSALFMPKNLWLELGGYDERFVCPGGGLANIDTYSRALELPDTQLIKLLGEGTFHQFHGGVATNALVHPFAQFNEEYFALRGRYFDRLPEQNPWYFGTLDQSWRLQRA